MNHTSQTFLMPASAGLPQNYDRLKEEYEVAELRGPCSSTPMSATVVNIPCETSVPDHVVWSLFNTLFMNFCCLGFIAFAYSVKARDRKMVGDLTGAQAFASTAKCLNIWALVLSILLVILIISATVALAFAWKT